MPYVSHFHPSFNPPRYPTYPICQAPPFGLGPNGRPRPPPPPPFVGRPPPPPPMWMARPMFSQQHQQPQRPPLQFEDPFTNPDLFAVLIALPPPMDDFPRRAHSYAQTLPSRPPPLPDSPPPSFFYPISALVDIPPTPELPTCTLPPAHQLDILKRRTRMRTVSSPPASSSVVAEIVTSPPIGPPPGLTRGSVKPTSLVMPGLPHDLSPLLADPQAFHLVSSLLAKLPMSPTLDKDVDAFGFAALPTPSLPPSSILFLECAQRQLDPTHGDADDETASTLFSIQSLFLLGEAREKEGGVRVLDGPGEEDYLEELVEALVGEVRSVLDESDQASPPLSGKHTFAGSQPTPPLTPSPSLDSATGCSLSTIDASDDGFLSTTATATRTTLSPSLRPLIIKVIHRLDTHFRTRLAEAEALHLSHTSAFFPPALLSSTYTLRTDPLALSAQSLTQTRLLISTSYLLSVLKPSPSTSISSPLVLDTLRAVKTIWTVAASGREGEKRAFGVGVKARRAHLSGLRKEVVKMARGLVEVARDTEAAEGM